MGLLTVIVVHHLAGLVISIERGEGGWYSPGVGMWKVVVVVDDSGDGGNEVGGGGGKKQPMMGCG